MNNYNFIFSKDIDGNITSCLGVAETGFVRTASGQTISPQLVQVGDAIRMTPHPSSVREVAEIVVTPQEV